MLEHADVRDRDATGGWRWDLTNETPWLSAEASEILGIDPSPTPLSLQVVARVLGQAQLKRFVDLRARQLREPAPFADALRVNRADGQTRDVIVRGWTIPVGGDGPSQILGICRDVTVGVPSAQGQNVRPPPAVTLPAAVDGVCGVGVDGRVTFTNQTLPTLMRCEGEEIVGRRLHDIVHRDRDGNETHSVEACPFTPEFTESAEAVDADFHRADGSRSAIVYTLIVPPGSESLSAIISMRDTAPRRMVTRLLQMSQRQVQELNIQRGALLGDVIVAEERERLRIAAELHDDTIQSLAAVAEYCRVMFAGSVMSHEVQGDVGGLDEVTHLLAYRLVQEAVRNAFTHSCGTRVLVAMTRTPSELVLSVSDDGVGMGEPLSTPTHAGLRILRTRAESAGGSARITTGIDGHGTVVEMRLPLMPAAPRSVGR